LGDARATKRASALKSFRRFRLAEICNRESLRAVVSQYSW
jgi:hypothetical protein